MKRSLVVVLFAMIIVTLPVLPGYLLASDDEGRYEQIGDRMILTDMNDAEGWLLSGKEGVETSTEVGDGAVTFRFFFASGEWYGAYRDFLVDLDKYPIIEIKLNELTAKEGGGWINLYLRFRGEDDVQHEIQMPSQTGVGSAIKQVEPEGVFRVNLAERFNLTGLQVVRVYISMYASGESWFTLDHVHALDSSHSDNLPV